MEENIIFYHESLQKHIHEVEADESNTEVLNLVREDFLKVFEMIKMIMISKKDRYYGCFLMCFELKIDFSMYNDASVNIDVYPFRMSINPLLLGLCTIPEMIYSICHEIEHIVLNHPAEGLKINPGKDPVIHRKLNIAMDASINDRLTMESETKGINVISEPEGVLTSDLLAKHYGVRMKKLQAFNYYYEHLPEEKSNEKKSRIIVMLSGGNNNEIVTDEKRRKKANGVVILHQWTESDNAEDIENLIRRFIQEAFDGMPESIRGNLPDYQKDALNRLLAPAKISWKRILKRYIGTVPSGYRNTRTRLSRRQPERFDVSGRINDRLIKLVVAIDTSGSMSKEMLENVFVEIFGIVGTKMCEITVIECDAEVQRIYKAKSINDVSFDVFGRGGTSFIPVIDYINNHRYYRDSVLVYFTDGMGDWSIPKPLVYKMLWVLYNDECKLSVQKPYGEVWVMD